MTAERLADRSAFAAPLGASRVTIRRASRMTIRLAICCSAAFAAVALVSGGCAPYQFGARTLFRDDIRTVHVPIARNDTFRHDLGPRLTEAVVRQIELRTPYKVTGDPNADSTLRLRVTQQGKNVLTESSSDDPRALDAVVGVSVDWVDRRGGPLLRDQWALETAQATQVIQSSRFVPEAGQSIQTAMQETIDDLADRIVSQMESRW